MWHRTPISLRLRIKYPIIQGPFGGKFSSTKLVSTVSNLGGLGSFGLNSYSPEDIIAINNEIQSNTNKPYLLNLWVPLKEEKKVNEHDLRAIKGHFAPYFEELGVQMPDPLQPTGPIFEKQVEALLEANPPVVSFIFGIPNDAIIKAFKDRGTTVIATATNMEEATAIEEAGIDLVIASGMEAGGHRATFLKTSESFRTGTQLLVQQIVQNLKIPVIAAGGITTGRDVKSVLGLGAGAAQMGTAFLATDESNAPQSHKRALLSKNLFQTELTKAYTGRWARAMLNQFIEDFRPKNENALPFPYQSTLLGPLRNAALNADKTEYLAYWAGQPSETLKHTKTEVLFKTLISEIENKKP